MHISFTNLSGLRPAFEISSRPVTEEQWKFVCNLPFVYYSLMPSYYVQGRVYRKDAVTEFVARWSAYTGIPHRLPTFSEVPNDICWYEDNSPLEIEKELYLVREEPYGLEYTLLEALVDKGDAITKEEGDLMEALSTLVCDYEQKSLLHLTVYAVVEETSSKRTVLIEADNEDSALAAFKAGVFNPQDALVEIVTKPVEVKHVNEVL